MSNSYSHWNYRVLQRIDSKSGEPSFGVHEVYYDSVTGLPSSYSSEPIDPYGSTLEELQAELERFQKALSLPVLTAENPFRKQASYLNEREIGD